MHDMIAFIPTFMCAKQSKWCVGVAAVAAAAALVEQVISLYTC